MGPLFTEFDPRKTRSRVRVGRSVRQDRRDTQSMIDNSKVKSFTVIYKVVPSTNTALQRLPLQERCISPATDPPGSARGKHAASLILPE